jgi:arabinose-5-phosphate isomerase
MSAIPADRASAADSELLIASGQRVIRIETQALQALQARIGPDFALACRELLACRGRVVCTGMGKSGHVARKIAATLASTGTPAFFLHPGEASHGDLGMVKDSDVVLALSNSGESEEILTIIPALKRQGNRIIAMTGRADSRMARLADLHVDVSVPEEACPLGLAHHRRTGDGRRVGGGAA